MPSSVAGVVKDREGKIVRGAAVTLWPLAYDFARRDGGALRTNSRHDGSFAFSLVAPGQYAVVAFEDLPDPGLAEYPAFVSGLAVKGSGVTVEPKQAVGVSLEIVSAEEIKKTLQGLE